MRQHGAVGGATYKHRLRVRFSECDPQGVVFNANYVAYFDVVITEMWREVVVPYQEMVAAGTDMVVAEVNVRFLEPARFDEELDFEVRVTRLGETAMSTRIDATTGGRPVAEGKLRHVFIDLDTQEKQPIPAHIRAALENYATDDAG